MMETSSGNRIWIRCLGSSLPFVFELLKCSFVVTRELFVTSVLQRTRRGKDAIAMLGLTTWMISIRMTIVQRKIGNQTIPKKICSKSVPNTTWQTNLLPDGTEWCWRQSSFWQMIVLQFCLLTLEDPDKLVYLVRSNWHLWFRSCKIWAPTLSTCATINYFQKNSLRHWLKESSKNANFWKACCSWTRFYFWKVHSKEFFCHVLALRVYRGLLYAIIWSVSAWI